MTCDLCGRPLDSGTVCAPCMDRARRALAMVPGLVPELSVALARLQRRGTAPGRRTPGERPLPIDLRALEAGQGLHAVLIWWARAVTRTQGGTVAHLLVPGLATWLRHHAEVIRQRDDAHTFVAEITNAVARVRVVVDLPPDQTYVGPCEDCQADLYTQPGRGWVTCPCGASYDVPARREHLLAQVSDRRASPVEISRALGTLAGVDVTTSVIRNLANRGRITPDALGRYRVGDVLQRILERQAKGESKRDRQPATATPLRDDRRQAGGRVVGPRAGDVPAGAGSGARRRPFHTGAGHLPAPGAPTRAERRTEPGDTGRATGRDPDVSP